MRTGSVTLAWLALVVGPASLHAHMDLDELGRALDAEVARRPADPALHLQRARVHLAARAWAARAAAIPSSTIPATPPLRAQLRNTSTGACVESTFTTVRRNDEKRLTVTYP